MAVFQAFSRFSGHIGTPTGYIGRAPGHIGGWSGAYRLDAVDMQLGQLLGKQAGAPSVGHLQITESGLEITEFSEKSRKITFPGPEITENHGKSRKITVF